MILEDGGEQAVAVHSGLRRGLPGEMPGESRGSPSSPTSVSCPLTSTSPVPTSPRPGPRSTSELDAENTTAQAASDAGRGSSDRRRRLTRQSCRVAAWQWRSCSTVSRRWWSTSSVGRRGDECRPGAHPAASDARPPAQVPTETVPEVWEEVRLAARRVGGPLTGVGSGGHVRADHSDDPSPGRCRIRACTHFVTPPRCDALTSAQSFDFVPHVTLRQEADEDRIRATVEALADLRIVAEARRLWLMQFQSRAGQRAMGAGGDVSLGTVRERPFGLSTLEMAVSVTRGPSALALLRDDLGRNDIGVAPPLLVHPGGRARVLAARVGPHVVGVAEMSWFEGEGLLHYVTVGPDHRGEGVGRALVREAIDLLVVRRVRHLDAAVHAGSPSALLDAYGFSPVGDGTWRITLAE